MLSALFPHISEEVLAQRLASHGGDVETTASSILADGGGRQGSTDAAVARKLQADMDEEMARALEVQLARADRALVRSSGPPQSTRHPRVPHMPPQVELQQEEAVRARMSDKHQTGRSSSSKSVAKRVASLARGSSSRARVRLLDVDGDVSDSFMDIASPNQVSPMVGPGPMDAGRVRPQPPAYAPSNSFGSNASYQPPLPPRYQ